MKAVITGATGFLGSALCRELTDSGHETTAIVRPSSAGRGRDLPVKELLCLPLEDLDGLTGDYDVFYHLAWNGSAGEARNDYQTQMSNLLYLQKAMEAAARCGCRTFIGAGSQAEYGVVREKAREDRTVPSPFMMYGAAKLSCFYLGRVLAGQLGLSFVWPRIYSVYGPRKDDPTLLGYVVRTLREGGVPELTECETMWDFLYLTDFTRAMRLLGEHEETSGVYHVASGKSAKLRTFVEQARDLVKPGGELRFGARSSDPGRTFWLEPDVGRLKALGFSCEVGFAEGIEILKRETTHAIRKG